MALDPKYSLNWFARCRHWPAIDRVKFSSPALATEAGCRCGSFVQPTVLRIFSAWTPSRKSTVYTHNSLNESTQHSESANLRQRQNFNQNWFQSGLPD